MATNIPEELGKFCITEYELILPITAEHLLMASFTCDCEAGEYVVGIARSGAGKARTEADERLLYFSPGDAVLSPESLAMLRES